jgi:hypothetical protein
VSRPTDAYPDTPRTADRQPADTANVPLSVLTLAPRYSNLFDPYVTNHLLTLWST